MRTVPTNMTIADYGQAMQRKEIVVNNAYQRSDKVWPPAARSYLVETVLLDFPVPKLSLHQKTDIKARRIVKEIVDGQQRSRALFDFYQDKFALSKSIETGEWVGVTFSRLSDDLQQQFIDYQLSIDLFTSASDSQVREVFRRMNSYTIPLNDEEQRHAKWQGAFKWFIHRIASRYDQTFLTLGVFTQKSLVRMQDTKLLTEVCRALTYGIETTKSHQLDEMYRLFDDALPQRDQYEHFLTSALDQLVGWSDIYKSGLMKPHILYALILAVIHLNEDVPELEVLFSSKGASIQLDAVILPRLTAMAEALSIPEEDRKNLSPAIEEFVLNSTGGRTNVKASRDKRFIAFCRALSTQAD